MDFLIHKWLLLFLLPFSPATVNSYRHLPAMAHPLYVSVTEISHNSKDKTLEISCKIFADDMEDVLEKNYKTTVDLTNGKQQEHNDKLIADYLSKRLVVAAEGKERKADYLGFEKESEAVYCYLEVKNIAAVKKLELTNSLLQDFSEEQINIMHVVVNGMRKSYKLDFPQQKASFTF